MAKKRSDKKLPVPVKEAEIVAQPITETIEKNYMPYIMTVITSRAIPEIDGLKPAHRKLLYTMYNMGLLTGKRTKSANVVGQTMRLNPHGDSAIYETLVRLTRANEALLHPLIDSKGSFGKQYSSNMKYAASRYTEVKLDPFCAELFRGIDKNAVDFVDNYDATLKEPTLFPTAFPNILVTPNTGIAVGMASSICPFNLGEICDGAAALLKDPAASIDKLMDIIKAPDFPGGAFVIYDRERIKSVYETGQGSIKLRARYVYDPSQNCIDVTQIPYSTTIEQIIKKITELVKDGKLKEITDIRDEIDLNGFKLTIDLRKGADPEKLMAKLYKMSPLEDSFKCNFNILIKSTPRQIGIIEILSEWIAFRVESLRRELEYDLAKKRERLHLLLGLAKILLDIDRAIKIVRETKTDADVVPNLAEGFGLDLVQAEYVADIRLRSLNREYILNRIKDIESLEAQIANISEIIADELKIKKLITEQLAEIKKKYGMPRRTQIIHENDVEEYDEREHTENYNVKLLLTREGYFKKITLMSLRGNDDQKLKDDDEVMFSIDADNLSELIFFSDRAQAYRVRVSEFDPVKSSELGDFIPAKLSWDTGERPLYMGLAAGRTDGKPGGVADGAVTSEAGETAAASAESGIAGPNMIFIFEDGHGVRVPVSSYQTKGYRRKLVGAYSDRSPIVAVFYEDEPINLLITNSNSRVILIKSPLIPQKTTRTSQGSILMSLRGTQKVVSAKIIPHDRLGDYSGCRKIKIPAAGVTPPDFEQILL